MENILTISLDDYEVLRSHDESMTKRCKELEQTISDLTREKGQMVIRETLCVSPNDNSILCVDYEVLNAKGAAKHVEDLYKDNIENLEQEVERLNNEMNARAKDWSHRLLAAENELCNLKSRKWWQRLWNKH